MAINPLYRNEYYFFSDMYDDSLITEFYRKISAESYDKSIRYQNNMLGGKRHRSDDSTFYKCKLGDLIIDKEYNDSLKDFINISNQCRSVKFNSMILPIVDKKKYISKYGSTTKVIRQMDFYKNPDIFDKSFSIQIGKYYIMNAYFIENKDKSVSIVFPDYYLKSSQNVDFIKLYDEYNEDEPVWIFTNEITQVYYKKFTSYTNFFNAMKHDVIVNDKDAINTIGDEIDESSWDCLVSFTKTAIKPVGLWFSFPCSCTKLDYGEIQFHVAEEYINVLKNVRENNKYTGAMYTYFINRPNRKHMLSYIYDENTSPIFNIDYNDNPAGNINIEVYELECNDDFSEFFKGRKLYDQNFTQLYFPNIFDFSNLNINNSNLVIEVSEYNPSYTNQKMHNSIKPLIDYIGKDNYTEFVVNYHDKNRHSESMGLQKYHPTYYPITREDYLSSEYFGNYRGYILDKIHKTIESDPYLFSKYYEWMKNIHPKVISKSGTPKTFKFNTGLTGERSGSNPIVMDTSSVSIISDDIQYFDEPHSYITYYNSNKKCPASIYLLGKYIRPTCTRFYKGVNYVFLPVRVIQESLTKYRSDDELVNVPPITIDIYPNAYCSEIDVPKYNFSIENIDEPIKLFKGYTDTKFSLNSLQFYDTVTKKYLGSIIDLFNINLIVTEFKIDNPGVTDSVLVSRGEYLNYLLTSMEEIYNTTNETPIAIETGKVSLSFNNFIDDLLSDGTITKDEISAFMNKVLDFKDIELIPKDSSLIGLDITVYPSNFKKEYFVKSDAVGVINGVNVCYELLDFTIDPNSSNYLIYVDNMLLPQEAANDVQLIIKDNSYNGKGELQLPKEFANREILIVHLPVEYKSQQLNYSSSYDFYLSSHPFDGISTDAAGDTHFWLCTNYDNIILECEYNVSDILYPLEDNSNMKFARYDNGNDYRLCVRIPNFKKNTNTTYHSYVSRDYKYLYNISNSDIIYNIALLLSNDKPAFTIKNEHPLDILLKV